MSHVIFIVGVKQDRSQCLCKQSGAMKQSKDTYSSDGTAVAISVDKMLYLCSSITYSINFAPKNFHSSSKYAYSDNLRYSILLKGL